jgi:hypothetical protein
MIASLSVRVLKRYCSIVLLPVLLVLLPPFPAFSETVNLSMTIDYPLLQSLVVRTAFTGSDRTAHFSDEQNGCWDVTIAEPEFFEKEGLLHFRTKIQANAAVYMFNRCMLPVSWEGYLTLIQTPKISAGWILSFDTIGSSVHDLQMRPATLAGIVWQLVETAVQEYLSRITIDLSPPILDLESLLHETVSTDLRTRAERMIGRMSPGTVSPSTGALGIEIRADVESVPRAEEAFDAEFLSESASDVFMENWEAFDSFLVFLLTSLSEKPLTEEERRIMLDVLLETRYRLVDELNANRLGKDFVREQFLSSWGKLSPIFRRQAREDTKTNLLGYLSFFTAIDALAALDGVGPAFNIEISRSGLTRLISMISDKGEAALEYGLDVDMNLREALGFGPPITAMHRTQAIESAVASAGRFEWFQVGLRPAWAEGGAAGRGVRAIVDWIFEPPELESYITRIRSLLEEAVDATLKKGRIQSRFHQALPATVFSTAWQESCLRQFTKRDGKIVILRSYNGTSVGLMQINERIWRGIYDQQSLRWDILYNAMAGCEILGLYLHKYALGIIDSKKLSDDAALAGLVYAMYNGGPGQMNKFIERKQTGKLYLSDRLFMEKLTWVTENRWENIRLCLIGN